MHRVAPFAALTLSLAVMLAACDRTLPTTSDALEPGTAVLAKNASYSFRVIEPCPGCQAGASGISNNGIVGLGVNGQGYLYDSHRGTFTAVPGTFTMTVPANNGEAPGVTSGANGAPAPVIRDRDGTVHQVPGFPGSVYTGLIQLNDNGMGVGWTSADFVHVFSFLRSRDGTYTPLVYPGPLGGTRNTILLGLNESGTAVGYLGDPTFTEFTGLIRRRDGTWELFMVPGATATMIYAINDAGTLAGTYRDAAGRWHGFVWTGGAVQTVDAPGAANTVVNGINTRGDLVVDTFDGADPLLTAIPGPSYLATR